jgi:hypothetical protein
MGQKDAVIAEVLVHLPNFQKFTDNAILLLSEKQLETIKATIYGSILTGVIEYSKDLTNQAEVKTYARSMVMNHLKKAKELNGGHSYVPNVSNSSQQNAPRTVRVKEKLAPKGVNPDLLPEELKEFAKTLI